MSSDNPVLFNDRLAQRTAAQSSKIAVSFLEPGPDGGKLQKQLSYQQLGDQASAVAALLQSKGLQKGDRVVLVYPPSIDFMVAFLACLRAGIIAVPVFPPNPARRDTLQMFSRIVDSCQPKFAVTNSAYNHLKTIGNIKETLTKLKQRKTTAAWPEQLEWIVTDKAASKTTTATTTEVDLQPSDVAFLQYTSGSTSEPKGVMITHGNIAHNLTIITADLQAVEDTVVVSWLPQFHDMGLIGSFLGCLYCGGSGYYMSPLTFLQRPVMWIEACSKYKATHLQAPNFAFKLTARKFSPANYTKQSLKLASVRHVINAAEPVDEDAMDAFYKAFGPFGFGKVIFPTYGLAEHTVFVCSGGQQRLLVDKTELEVNGRIVEAPTAGDNTAKMIGCGYPLRQGVTVRIVERETSTLLEDDTVGEIWVQSPSKAAGYYGKPTESKEDFHGQIDGSADGDGFLRTGDLGFLHKEELFICGRIKDLIIIGGRNYYPQDIEGTAEATSELLRPGCSAAFTIDQTREGGEEVALVMELRDVPAASALESTCGPLADQIRAAVTQEHSLGIAELVFLTPRTVPKTRSGKIARSWCRKAFVGGTLSVVWKKNYTTSTSSAPLEIDGSAAAQASSKKAVKPEEIRAMSKEELTQKLVQDIGRVGSLPPDAVSTTLPLSGMLDSLSLSQFKGLLENQYAVKISDEYLFRESTTVTKLVEVAKLGYAPDDGDHAGNGHASNTVGAVGESRGLAGALGCPPGVRCVIS